MRFKYCFLLVFLILSFGAYSQKSKVQQFKELNCPEKWWVITHLFVAKKAYLITEVARAKTDSIEQNSILSGIGNGDQVDAFRHTYWMALLTQEIGARRARSLGKAHEKSNYKDYKKEREEDGTIPDKVSSDMDLFNNEIGINIGMKSSKLDLVDIVVQQVIIGKCKILKIDSSGRYLDCDGEILTEEELKGTWINNKCLVSSDEIN